MKLEGWIAFYAIPVPRTSSEDSGNMIIVWLGSHRSQRAARSPRIVPSQNAWAGSGSARRCGNPPTTHCAPKRVADSSEDAAARGAAVRSLAQRSREMAKESRAEAALPIEGGACGMCVCARLRTPAGCGWMLPVLQRSVNYVLGKSWRFSPRAGWLSGLARAPGMHGSLHTGTPLPQDSW